MKNKTILTFIICISAFSTYSQNQVEKNHPIDGKLSDCLSVKSNQTTRGMINCESVAQEEWDKELNKYYKLLMNKLNPGEKKQLKEAQIQWLKFRDLEFNFSGSMHNNMQGTMWKVVSAGRITEIIKQRALDFKTYYETLKEAR